MSGTVEGSGTGSTGSGSTGSGSSGNSEASAISLTIANVAFGQTSLEAHEGDVTLTLVNSDPIGHDFTIDALGVKFSIGANQTQTFTFTVKPGIYEFYCSVPGHKQAGMAGSLTVLPAGGH